MEAVDQRVVKRHGNKHTLITKIAATGSLESLQSVIISNAKVFDQDHVAVSISQLTELMVGARTGLDVSMGRAPGHSAGPARLREWQQAQQLLSGLCQALLRFSDTATSQQISAALRGLASLSPRDVLPLVEQLGELLIKDDAAVLKKADPIEVAIMAWSLAKMHRALFLHEARQLEPGVADAADQAPDAEAASVDGSGGAGAGASAEAGPVVGTGVQAARAGAQSDPAVIKQLWCELAKVAELYADRMTSSELATTTWAFMSAGMGPQERVMLALAPWVLRSLPEAQTRDIVNLTFSYAKIYRDMVKRVSLRANPASWKAATSQESPLAAEGGAQGGGHWAGEQEVCAAARDVLSALQPIIKLQLPEFRPFQLSGILSSLHLGVAATDELLEAALPHVIKAAAHYGDDSKIAYTAWLASWQHLSQLAQGFAPTPGMFWLELRACGPAESATLAPLEGSGPRQELVAQAAAGITAAARQLLLRCVPDALVGGDREKRSLPLPIAKVAIIMRLCVQAAPDCAPALARGIAAHLLCTGQLQSQMLTRTHIINLIRMFPASGLSGADVLQGKLWPTVMDAIAQRAWALNSTRLAMCVGTAADLRPQPKGLLPLLARPLADSAHDLSPAQLHRVVSAYVQVEPWKTYRQQEQQHNPAEQEQQQQQEQQQAGVITGTSTISEPDQGSGGGDADAQTLIPAPDHWAWDTSKEPPPCRASVELNVMRRDPFALLAAALARRAQAFAVESFANAAASAPAEVDDVVFASGPHQGPGYGNRRDDPQGWFVDVLVGLRHMGLDDPAFLSRMLAPALAPGGGLTDVCSKDAARLLVLLADTCSSGGSGSSNVTGVDGGDEAGTSRLVPEEFVSFSATLAHQLESAGALEQLPRQQLQQLHAALETLDGLSPAALGSLQAAVGQALAAAS